MRLLSARPTQASTGAVAKTEGPKNKIPSLAWGYECYAEAVDRWAYIRSKYAPPPSFGEWKASLTAAGEKIAGRKASDKKKEEAAVAVASFLAGPKAGAFFSEYVIPLTKKILGKSPSEEAYDEAMVCFQELVNRGQPLWPFFGGSVHPNLLKAIYCERRDVFLRGDIDSSPLVELWADLILTIKNPSVAWMASVQWPFGLPHFEPPIDLFPASGKGRLRYWVPSFTKVISGFAVIEAATRGLPSGASHIAARAIQTFYTEHATFDLATSKRFIAGKLPSYFNETVLKSGPSLATDGAGWSQYLHAQAARVVQNVRLSGSEASAAASGGSSSSVGSVAALAVWGGAGYAAVKFGPALYRKIFSK